MLIQEKFENTEFSSNERLLVNYILKHKMAIKDMTTKQLAEATYTSPSSLIRIAHKMGYDGWNDLKNAYLKEVAYLETHFSNVDANYPFKANDPIMSIASKIAVLKKESIDDTLSLIDHDDLQKAIKILNKASMIQLYAVSNNLNIIQEFAQNMRRIKKKVEVQSLEGEQVFTASLMNKDECAIIVSYSGETVVLTRVARTLKARGIPFIAITNIGDSTISKLADVNLRITTREVLFSKIATFTTDEAINYLLDVLYSCVFALDYDKNKKLRAGMSQVVEKGRFSSISDINETYSDKDVYTD